MNKKRNMAKYINTWDSPYLNLFISSVYIGFVKDGQPRLIE